MQANEYSSLIIEFNEEAQSYLEWKPDNNTLAFMPFTTDLKNQITGNLPTSTRSSVTVSGGYAQYRGGATYYTLGKSYTKNAPRTIFQWLRPTNRRSYSARVGMIPDYGFFVLRNDSGNQPRFAINDEGSGSWSATNALPMPLNEWHCWVVTRDGTNLLVYKDGNSAVSYNGAGKFPPSGTSNQFYIGINNQYDYYDGDAGYVGLQEGARSETEAQAFFKKTKKYFGM